ncbi:MAG: hypothetical protein D6696_17740 [Acidobacteria bacterium]|nr:MAG: hypothetical protein D6696_17740 [Acidobacteriota bacterium]
MKICPTCGTANADDRTLCESCGDRLPEASPAAPKPPPFEPPAARRQPPPLEPPDEASAPSAAGTRHDGGEVAEHELLRTAVEPGDGAAASHEATAPAKDLPLRRATRELPGEGRRELPGEDKAEEGTAGVAGDGGRPSRAEEARDLRSPSPPRPTAAEARRETPATEERPEAGEAGERTYDEIVGDVDRHIADGYKLFVVVGHPGSGKTHALKALHLLLERQGFLLPEARRDFRQAHVPGSSGHTVKDFICDGPRGEKWLFVDVGGELYTRLLDNDWRSRRDDSLKLTRRLRHAQGLLFFLHLQREHLDQGPSELDPALFTGDRERYEVKRRKAMERQRELDLFDHFLLFFRAILHQRGDVDAVIDRCRQAGDVEKALRDQRDGAPPLEVPVMFFFTQADKYAAEGFEIGAGRHLAPRELDLPAAVFAARHLPFLFGSLLKQVRRFKFDFLQSYEESNSGQLDEAGQPKMATHWQAEDGEPLSVGLLAGLEFLLRNQPPARRRDGPGIDARTALWLHRLLHPRAWRGVKVALGNPLRRLGGGG